MYNTAMKRLKTIPESFPLDSLITEMFEVMQEELRPNAIDLYFRHRGRDDLHCWYRQTQGRSHEASYKAALAAYSKDAYSNGGYFFAYPLKARNDTFGVLVCNLRTQKVKRVEEFAFLVDYFALLLYSAKLSFIANKDKLTGFYNRGFIYKTLNEWYENKEPFGGILLDIDHFKHYNDKYGHPVGDMVLKELSAALKKNARGLLLGRYGGEEFLIGIKRADEALVKDVMEKVRILIKNTDFSTDEYALRVTASLGGSIIEYRDGADKDIDALIATADAALYSSKRAGRNRSTYQSGKK